ncbi:C6 zinc finger domain protein [Apiospora arundinis]
MPRKGFEKARTGCITCKTRKVKCDEAKPHCARCQNSGRACDGYAAPPLGSYSWLRLLRARPSTIPSNREGQHNSMEMRSLDYFRCVVAPALSGPMHAYFWTSPIQQLSVQDVSIRQAVLAISLLYENFDSQAQSDSPCQDTMRRQECAALTYYNKTLRQVATSQGLDITVVLFLAILFTCIECLRDNHVAAIDHCRHAAHLLKTCRNPPAEILPLIHHLSIFPFCFGATPMEFPVLPSRKVSSVEPLRNVYETGQSIDSLLCRTVRLVRVTDPYQFGHPRVIASDALPTPHLLSSLHELSQDLDVWYSSLLDLRGKDCDFEAEAGTARSSGGTSPHSAIYRTVEMRWLVCKIWVETGLSQNEDLHDDAPSPFDAHLARFERMVQLGREELADRESAGTVGKKNIFTFDMGMSPLLYFAAVKCRDLPLRLEALVLMEKLLCPRATVWNANMLRATCRQVVELEHGIRLPMELQGYDWQECLNLDRSYTSPPPHQEKNSIGV